MVFMPYFWSFLVFNLLRFGIRFGRGHTPSRKGIPLEGWTGLAVQREREGLWCREERRKVPELLLAPAVSLSRRVVDAALMALHI